MKGTEWGVGSAGHATRPGTLSRTAAEELRGRRDHP